MKKTQQRNYTARLSRPYISVRRDGSPSYGGSQNWFGGMIRICGCAVIGAADLLWYLKGTKDPTPEEYDSHVLKTRKSFFLIPFRGLPGILTPPLLGLTLRKNDLPYTARWGAGRVGIRKAAAAMIRNDIPVPVCIGPCLHQLGAAPLYRGLRFYEKRAGQDQNKGNGQAYVRGQFQDKGNEQERAKDQPSYVWVKTVRNHLVIMTGIEGRWARVSSWGLEYYIDLKELEELSRGDAFGVFTNIIRIIPRGSSRINHFLH